MARSRHSSLDRSLLLGVAWTAGMKWATQVLSWASTLVIARLLVPADYGLFGMAMVYMGFVAPIYDLGLSAAIIQRRDMDHDQIARLGGLSLMYGIAFSLLSVALAEPIALYFREPAVRQIVQLLSVAYLITAPQMLPRALLARDLHWRKLAWIDGTQAIVLTGATLVLALLGYRYWSFVYAEIAAATMTTVLALVWAPHRIAWPSRFRGIAGAATFGSHVALARIGYYVYSNADFAIVGRVLGKAILGAYTFGWTLATIPVDRVSSLVARVIPSILSAVQTDLAALRRYTLALTEGLAFVALPLSVGLALTADQFVRLALGPNWSGAVGPLRLLAFYGGYRSIATIISPLLVATGDARRNFQFTLFAVCVLPPLFYLGARWGATGVAAAWIVGFPIATFPAYRRAFQIMEMRWSEYAAALRPALTATAVMALAVLGVRAANPASLSSGLSFAAEVIVGAAVYLTVVMWRYRDRVQSFLTLVKSLRTPGDNPEPEPTGGASPAIELASS
jgi:O-antigen/teichoic acid export membrane protein